VGVVSFSIWFMGGEQPGFQKILLEQEATHLGVSFWGLKRRMATTKPYLFEEKVDDSFVIFLDSGGYSLNRGDLSNDAVAEYADLYKTFLLGNLDRIALVSELDAQQMGKDWIREERLWYEDNVPSEKFLPVWHEGESLDELQELARLYDNVGIPEAAVEHAGNLAGRVNGWAGQYGTDFHALACAKPDDLRAVRFTTAATSSWLSPMKYGETIIWDGTKLHRYPKSMKDMARRRHKMLITRAGFDHDLIVNDDPDEVARLTAWSYLQLEESVDKRRPSSLLDPFGQRSEEQVVDRSTGEVVPLFAEKASTDIDNTPATVRNYERPVAKAREPQDRRTLPTMALQEGNEDGTDTGLLVRSSKKTNRMCDTCYLQAQCPAMQPQSECAYDLPLEIKTKEQLISALQAVLEIHVGRVAFMQFAEDLNGGYADPNTSLEITRLFDLVERLKKIQDDTSFLRIEMRDRPAGGGVLSNLFGPKAQELGTLARPLDEGSTNRMIAGVLEGEVGR
jgi:hypothetical protein